MVLLVIFSQADFTGAGRPAPSPGSTPSRLAAQIAGIAQPEPPLRDDAARPVAAPSGAFETSPELRSRVDFWKWIFTDVNSYQAIIHDSFELQKVFAVVDLRKEYGVRPGDHYSLNRAARDVLERYKSHLRVLIYGYVDPGKLTPEQSALLKRIGELGGPEALAGAYKNVRVQRGLRDMMRDSIIRSGRYLQRYKQILREHGIPEELALLPHVESSFRHDASSYAGAVGIWQLTSSASRRLLVINANVDERMDPWRSAEAAAQILNYNYRKLGSWALAITAYNQGVGGMSRAVQQTGSRRIEDIIERYRSRSFRFAGRNFYPSFLAVLELIQDYENHFGPLQVEPELLVRRHKLSKSMPLRQVCRELGVSPSDLEPLNPALRKNGFREGAVLPRGVIINLPVTAGGGDSGVATQESMGN